MFHFDQRSGDLFIADVGQNHWEEINYQPASSKGGENYGWKFNEAAFCHPALSANQKCPIVGVLPIAKYPHTEAFEDGIKANNGGGSSQGLVVANYGGLNKTYMVCDWCSGRLFGVAWDDVPRSGRCRSSCRRSFSSPPAMSMRMELYWR
jgi:hypothetical protein